MSCALFLFFLLAPLSAYIEPVKQTVDVGKKAILNCSIYGYPIKKVTWYKDGQPLAPGSHMTLETETALVIDEVARENEGMYQCMVENDQDSAQGSSLLMLGGKINL